MKVAIFGGQGQLGKEFQRRFCLDGTSFAASDLPDCDITQKISVERYLDEHRPTVAINCAAYNLVDDAEDNRDKAYLINAEAVKILACACQQRGILLVHYSTDYVFDGLKGSSYLESDETNPLGVYAASKLAGEKAALESAEHLVFRLSWVIGPGKQNFLYKLSQWAEKSDTLKITVDETSVPTFTTTVVEVTLLAIAAKVRGLYHLTNSGQASRLDLAKAYFEARAVKKELIPVSIASFSLKARRPVNSAMSNAAIQKKLGIVIPEWKQELLEYVRKQKEN